MKNGLACGCGRIDVHAHFCPKFINVILTGRVATGTYDFRGFEREDKRLEAGLGASYLQALNRRGLTTVNGGMPLPPWNAELALATMDKLEIETAILSVSSPSTHVLPIAAKPDMCRAVNLAGIRRRSLQ